MNQSDGCEHWMWLSPGRPPALHAMSPDPPWERGLCLLPAAWEATTPSGGHRAAAQSWPKTLAQPSSSLRQDPSRHCQTLGPVGNSQEGGTGGTLIPLPRHSTRRAPGWISHKAAFIRDWAIRGRRGQRCHLTRVQVITALV